jgi:nucleoside phosphorylase
MKILVTFAVAAEFAAWRRQRGFRRVAREPFPLYSAEIGGNPVRVLLTGIGASAATRAMNWALASPTDMCIASGFAGALRPTLGVGEVLAARVVRRAGRELAVASDHEDQGKIRLRPLLLELAAQPQRIPALLRLARDCRLAAGRLAIFLDAYLALLSARRSLSQPAAVAAS